MTKQRFVLDLETRATNDHMIEHGGLEPWRVRQGNSEIFSCDVYGPGYINQIVNRDMNFKDRLREQLRFLKGQVVYAHNAVFDVAWLIATLQPDRYGPIPQEILDIDWRDSMLLFKWLINGQKAEASRFRLDLGNLVKTFLPDHPKAEEFVEMKSKAFRAGENLEYWLERGSLDVMMTWELVDKYESRVPESMRAGLLTEFKCIVPVANSWIMGFKIDTAQLDFNENHYRTLKSKIAKQINCNETLFSSPKQLSKLLYVDMGLMPGDFTATGNPSTSSGALKWLEFNLNQRGDTEKAKIIRAILDAKSSSTNYSKYVKSTIDALSHTGDGHIYSSPRLFGTYTGRMTYSNTVTHKDPDSDMKKKYKTSIAMHQIPRKEKLVRKMLLAPENHKILEFDASGQESRLMALQSRDPVMIDIFQRDLNFHSMTGASIIGMDYDDFESNRKLENDEGYLTEARQRGKLTNLACNFRISGRSLASQAFEKYDVMIDVATGVHLVNTFANSYQGVPKFWARSIELAKLQGYSETYGGRRFKISHWANERWGSESSAIMFPIQGSGASMKEIAIAELSEKCPEFLFSLDLHDASFGYARADIADEVYAEAERILNSIDYTKYWGFEPDIALPYEGKMGVTFADVK